MAAVEIPSYFLCPISLEMMRDPVALPTGITYDRRSIERWLFEAKQRTCPVTKQQLAAGEVEIIPNHTLRRLIQAWCTLNSSHGVERIPTPRSPIDKRQIAELLEEAKLPHSQIASLQKLKQIVAESERNRRCVESAPGAIGFLASLVAKSPGQFELELESGDAACDEAIAILHALHISDEGLFDLVAKNPGILESLTVVLQRSNYRSRNYAMMLLRSLLGLMSRARLIGLPAALFEEVVCVVRDGVSPPATKAALRALLAACPWGRNRVKAVEAGAAHALVELLLHEDGEERRVCELALAALDLLCGCAEGRAELVRHRGAVAVVSKKILRVSALASEKSVKILYAVARYSATAALLQEMVQVGAVSKLCTVVQVGGGGKAAEKAGEILRLHSRAWMNSPCLPPTAKIAFQVHNVNIY